MRSPNGTMGMDFVLVVILIFRLKANTQKSIRMSIYLGVEFLQMRSDNTELLLGLMAVGSLVLLVILILHILK